MNSDMYSPNLSTLDDTVKLVKSATTNKCLRNISLDEGDWRNWKKGNLLFLEARINLATPATTNKLQIFVKTKLQLANDKHETNFHVYGPNGFVQIVRFI